MAKNVLHFGSSFPERIFQGEQDGGADRGDDQETEAVCRVRP